MKPDEKPDERQARGGDAARGPRTELPEREEVAPLVRLLESAPVADEEVARAVEVLCRRRSPEALGLLVRWLGRVEVGDPLFDELIEGLSEWGPAVAPALWDVLETASGDARVSLVDVLARCGARDERTYALLLEVLEEEPFRGAINLASYGDPRAVGPLERALDAYALADDEADVFAQQTVLELGRAIQDLGGSLEGARREKLETARRLRDAWTRMFDRWRATFPVRRVERPGRNEPCWCGSGVKYKKCHWGEEPR